MARSTRMVWGAFALAMAMAGSGTAGVRVVDAEGVPVPASAWNAIPAADGSGWIITLEELWNPWANSWFAVAVDSGEDISGLVIDVDGPPAGSPVTVTVGVEGPPIRRIGEILQTGTAEVLLHDVRVVDSLGRVDVQVINFIDVAGSVDGPIIATTSTSALRGIRRLEIGGDLLGDVKVAGGTVRELTVRGRVGRPDAPVVIEAGEGLWSLEVRGDCHAEIDLCPGSRRGFLHRLEAENFTGSLLAHRLDRPTGSAIAPAVTLTGVLEGIWSFRESLVDEEAGISLPAGGLRGQIVINADGDPLGQWRTPVRLGAGSGQPLWELTGPTYAPDPVALGGGAVGLMPYRIHATGCEPPSGMTVDHAMLEDGVVLQFHGPLVADWIEPLRFQRRRMNDVGAFDAVPSGSFRVETDSQDPRRLRVMAADAWNGFEPGWEYRILPTEQLTCGPVGGVPVSDDVAYHLSIVGEGCPEDLDQSGQIDIVEILLILAFWGPAETPAAGAADVTGDGQVGIDDLLQMLRCWGPCS